MKHNVREPTEETNFSQSDEFQLPDRVGALSLSSNDTVHSEDVDSVSLGILPEL